MMLRVRPHTGSPVNDKNHLTEKQKVLPPPKYLPAVEATRSHRGGDDTRYRGEVHWRVFFVLREVGCLRELYASPKN